MPNGSTRCPHTRAGCIASLRAAEPLQDHAAVNLHLFQGIAKQRKEMPALFGVVAARVERGNPLLLVGNMALRLGNVPVCLGEMILFPEGHLQPFDRR
jgi:hypothetical protein